MYPFKAKSLTAAVVWLRAGLEVLLEVLLVVLPSPPLQALIKVAEKVASAKQKISLIFNPMN